MLLYVLNDKYETLFPLDSWISVLWPQRFREAGEMELVIPASIADKERFARGNYICCTDSEQYMIIEGYELKTDPDEGDRVTITGRTLESILDRRIIWNRIDWFETSENTVVGKNLQDLIGKILNENIINPEDESRRIPNFIFTPSTDPRITDLTVACSLYGENIYNQIISLCEDADIGFKILPYGDGGFEFMLYAGTDRSYNQDDLPWVVFSPEFENLSGSMIVEKDSGYKTTALVFNERTIYDSDTQENDVVRTTVEVNGTDTPKSGLDRREMFIESTKSNRTEDDQEMSDNEYIEVLTQEGAEALSETVTTTAITGDIEAVRQYIYGRDFFLGDIVSFKDGYGNQGDVRVMEMLISSDDNGDVFSPSFTNVNSNA